MSAASPLPAPDSELPPQLEPTATRPGPTGGALRIGNPGNRGNPRGRTTLKTIIRVSKDLDAELKRLREWANAALTVTCPCGCGHEWTPRPTGLMGARDRIAYARLLADIKAGGKGEDEVPVGIVVATGSAADVRSSVTHELGGVELVTEGPAAIGPGNPELGPPERTRSTSPGG